MNTRPVAMVTGGRRGIGRAIALELAGIGHDLVVGHVRPPDAQLAETSRAIEARGAAVHAVQADVSRAADRERLLAETRSAFGRLDLLVNNAGVAPARRGPLLETTEESFDRVMAINLKGPFFLAQAVARWMIAEKERHPERALRIVNIGSISAHTASPERGEYCISKAGLGMVTALFAASLADRGIAVFEVRPGLVETDMTRPVREHYDRRIREGLTPIRRWGRPEDVAAAVRAVAEGRLDFSPGQVIHVDGGFHLRRL